MIIELVFYVCTNASMADCAIWRPRSWKGASAYHDCMTYRAKKLEELAAKAPGTYVRVECAPPVKG